MADKKILHPLHIDLPGLDLFHELPDDPLATTADKHMNIAFEQVDVIFPRSEKNQVIVDRARILIPHVHPPVRT
ncbi:hypothetical protein [Desulfosarcina cetonica]|uniref:hypothetical protein n=1 Tax=Desulfosarcina cetonica TaxID=90730 RepID=UPI001FF03C53|nr:hypothetical protein [Desulfosarcina cetonica]